MKKTIISAFIILFCSSCGGLSPRTENIIFVGTISRDCKLIEKDLTPVPWDFEISPQKAIDIYKIKGTDEEYVAPCDVKFFGSIYADSKSYYLLMDGFTQPSKLLGPNIKRIKNDSTIINGKSGEIIKYVPRGI